MCEVTALSWKLNPYKICEHCYPVNPLFVFPNLYCCKDIEHVHSHFIISQNCDMHKIKCFTAATPGIEGQYLFAQFFLVIVSVPYQQHTLYLANRNSNNCFMFKPNILVLAFNNVREIAYWMPSSSTQCELNLMPSTVIGPWLKSPVKKCQE